MPYSDFWPKYTRIYRDALSRQESKQISLKKYDVGKCGITVNRMYFHNFKRSTKFVIRLHFPQRNSDEKPTKLYLSWQNRQFTIKIINEKSTKCCRQLPHVSICQNRCWGPNRVRNFTSIYLWLSVAGKYSLLQQTHWWSDGDSRIIWSENWTKLCQNPVCRERNCRQRFSASLWTTAQKYKFLTTFPNFVAWELFEEFKRFWSGKNCCQTHH